MTIFVSQRRYDNPYVGFKSEYVNCGVLSSANMDEDGLLVDLQEVPAELYTKLVPFLRKKGFKGAIGCWTEEFTESASEDRVMKIGLIDVTAKGFSYRKLGIPGLAVEG